MGARQVLLQALKWSVEGTDPIDRARVRSGARQLVRSNVGSDDDSTPDEVAEVALLRVLDLQSRVRRAALKGEHEGAVLLARSAVESCLVGLYCLYGDDVLDALNRDNARRMKRMVRYLADSESFPPGMIDAAVAELGPSGSFPTADRLAKAVVAGGGPEMAQRLYELVYVPVSTMYVHSSGVALVRHIDVRSRATRRRPWAAWGKRSPTHVSDACVGLLAAAVARNAGKDSRSFDEYARLHWDRVVIPNAFMMFRIARSQVEWSALPGSIWLIRNLRNYLRTPAAAGMERLALEGHISDSLDQIWRAFRSTPPPQLQQVFISAIADSILATPAHRGSKEEEGP